MILERITSPGLAHNSYLLGSGSDAAVIDPRRDCRVYVDMARDRELRIRHIFETHRNEDYAIGSLELARLTGAQVYHGPGLPWKYGSTLVDGQQFKLGTLLVNALHTPGHTDESMSYVVGPARGGATIVVFSGDALFAGDVGRTDLYGLDQAERLASTLYESVFGRLLPLGDGVILCPAHGAGSVCGTRIADRDNTTIGTEKALNRALQAKSKSEFVANRLAEKPETPPYFRQMEKYNLEGPPPLGPTPEILPPLSVIEFKAAMESGAIVIDTREPPAFGGAHIKGSYSIWLEGMPSFAGWFLPYDTPILLILEDPSHVEKAARYLLRLGYDRIAGYLGGGLESWYNAGLPIETLALLSVHQLRAMIDRGDNLTVLDVRGADEWKTGHVGAAKHMYVGDLEGRSGEVPTDRPVAAYCTVGRRSGLGASILLRAGHPAVSSVLGSITAWKAAGFAISKE